MGFENIGWLNETSTEHMGNCNFVAFHLKETHFGTIVEKQVRKKIVLSVKNGHQK